MPSAHCIACRPEHTPKRCYSSAAALTIRSHYSIAASARFPSPIIPYQPSRLRHILLGPPHSPPLSRHPMGRLVTCVYLGWEYKNLRHHRRDETQKSKTRMARCATLIRLSLRPEIPGATRELRTSHATEGTSVKDPGNLLKVYPYRTNSNSNY